VDSIRTTLCCALLSCAGIDLQAPSIAAILSTQSPIFPSILRIPPSVTLSLLSDYSWDITESTRVVTVSSLGIFAMHASILILVAPYLFASSIQAACTSSTTSTIDIQNALTQGGEGYTLQLCQGETYNLDQVLNYTAANQVRSASNLSSVQQVADFVGNLDRGLPDGREASTFSCRRFQRQHCSQSHRFESIGCKTAECPGIFTFYSPHNHIIDR
jgi:hypothetical protein